MSRLGDFVSRIVRPWVGDQYRTRQVPLRLLIVGDSHHGDITSRDELETIKTIQSYFLNTNRSFAFFTRIMATVAGSQYWTLDRQKFYHDVAFFNYVDGVAVHGSRERPSGTQFFSSATGFKAIVDELSPEVVFCCGADVRRHVESDLGTRDVLSVESEGLKADYIRCNDRFFFFSRHPSSGYSKKWAGVVQRLAEIEGFAERLDAMRGKWIKS